MQLMQRQALIQSQSGSMLLEALIAILIFSMGILAIVGLQAASIKASSDAKYRTEASFLANELIGQMWVSNRTASVLEANFEGAGGDGGDLYVAWAGNSSTMLSGTVLATLPGAQLNPPRVTVTPVGTSTPSSLVKIEIYWQSPGESSPHNYTTIAQIM